MEYASNGKGNLGVTLGAIGTGLGLFGGSNVLGNLLGGNNEYVSKETFATQLQLVDAQKENAVLMADLTSERKINALRDELNSYIRGVDAKINDNAAAQAVINCQLNSQVNLNTSQIAQLFNLTKLGIASTNIWTA